MEIADVSSEQMNRNGRGCEVLYPEFENKAIPNLRKKPEKSACARKKLGNPFFTLTPAVSIIWGW
jgi:hypothetical protein